MKDEITRKIISLLDENIIDGHINNSEEIQMLIDNSQEKLSLRDYYGIVYIMLKKLGLEEVENINTIFSAKPKFSIETYKKILRIEAAKKFDELKVQKESLFVSLSRNLCNDLTNRSVNDVLVKYAKELEQVKKIDKSNMLIHLIKEHKDALMSCDNLRINNTRTNIRNYIKKFNAKYKEYYIKKYVDLKIEEIKPYFEIKKKSAIQYHYVSEEAFIKWILNDSTISNSIKTMIYKNHEVEVNNNMLKKIIHNILINRDSENYDILNIKDKLKNINNDEIILKETKAYHRLTRSYLSIIESRFSTFDKNLLLNIFNDIDNLNNYKHYLTQEQYNLLSEVKIVYKEANCNLYLINNKLVFVKENKIDNIEFTNIKINDAIYKSYLRLKKEILRYYSYLSKAKKEIIYKHREDSDCQLLFDDDNYKLKNIGIFMNIEIMFNILKKLDKDKIVQYNDEVIQYIKKIIFNDGILGCAMECNSDIDIASIINGIGTIKDFDKIKKLKNIDISYLLKQTNLYNIADDFSISILTSDVANKLVNNNQFIQNNTTETKKTRLIKAVNLSIKSIDIKMSAIPFDMDTKYKDVTISRYNNDDPSILTTGIDSNTCIKLDGNDNDFLIYALLNKLCSIFKINYGDNGRIGHIICFRQSNVLFINGIRIINEKEEHITKELLERNKDIFKCVCILANKFIDVTKNTEYPIDFVVCNKAGILESSYFNDYYYIVPDYLINQPVDIYNDDWQEFIHSFDKEKIEYFKQVNYVNNVGFTTDFGNYPALMIASRDNRYLERKFDIAYFSPGAIYERPIREEEVYTSNFNQLLEKIYRIDAISYYQQIKSLELSHRIFRRRKIDINNIKEVCISDYYYKITYFNQKVEEVNADINSTRKLNVRVKKKKI